MSNKAKEENELKLDMLHKNVKLKVNSIKFEQSTKMNGKKKNKTKEDK
jgi:hypothetical protein